MNVFLEPEDPDLCNNFTYIEERGNKTYCFNEKFKTREALHCGPYCSDCWKSQSTQYMCFGMLGIFSITLILMTILMLCYHSKRQWINEARTISHTYYIVFFLLVCWQITLLAYFFSAFINYSWWQLHFTFALPMINTYIIVGVCTNNM